MEGVIGLIVLVGLIVFTYYLVSNITSNLSNKKLRSLIVTSIIFIVVMLFIIFLPIVGGYSYDDFQDVIDVLFDEKTAPMLTFIVIGFSIAIVYFACGAYSIWIQEKTVNQINKCKNEILMLQQKIKRKDTIVHFIELLSNCDADITGIVNNPKITEIQDLTEKMECKKQKLNLLKQQLNK